MLPTTPLTKPVSLDPAFSKGVKIELASFIRKPYAVALPWLSVNAVPLPINGTPGAPAAGGAIPGAAGPAPGAGILSPGTPPPGIAGAAAGPAPPTVTGKACRVLLLTPTMLPSSASISSKPGLAFS